ncbi:MAG TPA: hypothetical protein VHJ78_13925 [Actinomycetota bacterium]|nr:hypothetical protein [Actinomycetota bacterium]
MLAALAALPAAPSLAAGKVARELPAAAEQHIEDLCRAHGLRVLEGTAAQCTHGEDPAPPGKDIKRDVKPVTAVSSAESDAAGQEVTPGAPTFACDGDGTSGYRTQVMYVHAAGTADRFATYRASFLQWASDADQIYRGSAADTGGIRRIRFVHDSSCTPTILNVTLSAAGDDNLTNTINELQDLGYERSDRKYLIFMDANVLCGVGTMVVDDRPGQDNWNNQGPDYGRIDSGCWSGDIAAHEHMHTMGGVQNSAPHASGGNHCTDEYDVMCYSDAPNYPSLQVLCPTSSRDWTRFDCGYDDYFNANPPAGSYLATRWNTANNRFLANDAGGSTPITTCPDQALEPDEAFTSASALSLGTARDRALCAVGDQDWMSFPALANQRYRVEVLNKASGITPSLEVFAGNGTKLLASNVPATGLAVLQFRTRTGGTHYVRVKNATASYTAGTANTYQVRVSAMAPSGTALGGFGFNAYNEVGGPPSSANLVPAITFNVSAVQTSAGYLHSAAVMSDGTVRAWGWNGYGQLGNGTRTDSAAQVNPGLTGVVSVSAGYGHTVALKSDGTVWAWGWNAVGHLGDGTYLDRTTPVRVAGLTDVVEISAGWLHNLALKRDGTVWAWGYNQFGTFGDGTTTSRPTPAKTAIPKATAVSAGAHHSLAVTHDGRVMAWGYNAQGQIGDGTRTLRTLPVFVPGMSSAYRVAAGYTHSVGLSNDGTVRAWGENQYGQAGAIPSPDRILPGAVSCSADASCPKAGAGQAIGKIAWISSGGGLHNAALADNGTVWTWGWNGVGQLGNGAVTDSGVAVKAAGVVASDAAAGLCHTLYLA